MQDLINHFKGKKILILGFGAEGRSSYNFLRKYFKRLKIDIADRAELDEQALNLLKNDENIEVNCGSSYLSNLYKYDIVLKSPGISLKHVSIDVLNQNISSQTELFLRFFGNQSIGVTGTKGKSTTVSLIHHILNKAGKKNVLGGNIGVPVFDLLPLDNDFLAVLEISSHQLEFCHFAPKLAILLNVYEEHLDHYKSYEQYKRAKYNIATYQGKESCLIYNSGQAEIAELAKKTSAETKIAVSMQKAFELEGIKTKLVGKHNLFNILVAIKACKLLGINTEESIKHIESFNPLEHRLEYFAKYNGIDFYNDSISTVPQSAISALKAVKNASVLICGGINRGVDLEPLATYLKNNKQIKSIFICETGKMLYAKHKNEINCEYTESLQSAVKLAYKNCKANCAVVFSPAAASYGYYKNFAERGKDFKKLVKLHYERVWSIFDDS